MDDSEQTIKDLEKQVAGLKKIADQKQFNIEFREKMIELAKDHYGIDIMKDSGKSPSAGSASTSKDSDGQ